MIIGNGKLITLNNEVPYIENGAVYIVDGTISDFGETKNLREKYKAEEFYDVKGRIIMPGLINCHTHFYSAYARGMSAKGSTRDFIEILKNLWWNLDKKLELEDVYLNAMTTMIESAKFGVTSIFDHHASPYHLEKSLFEIDRAGNEIGLRHDLCYEVSDRDGKEIRDLGIKENIDFIEKVENDDTGMVGAHFGIHASFTISDETMDKINEAMSGKTCGYHIHTAEGIEDEIDSEKKYNKRVIERLYDRKMLGENTLAIHCCNINEREIELLSKTNTTVVTNPESNMGNAVGTTPSIELLEKGVLLGLGTDAYTQDMLESLKAIKTMMSHYKKDPTVGFLESFKLLFENNGKIASRSFKRKIGKIEKGYVADIATFSYNPHTPLDENSYMGHIIFGLQGKMATDTIVDGKFVMKENKIITVDEEEIYKRSRERAKIIWNK